MVNRSKYYYILLFHNGSKIVTNLHFWGIYEQLLRITLLRIMLILFKKIIHYILFIVFIHVCLTYLIDLTIEVPLQINIAFNKYNDLHQNTPSHTFSDSFYS